jgi:hypothetical protein
MVSISLHRFRKSNFFEHTWGLVFEMRERGGGEREGERERERERESSFNSTNVN